ncbi:VOC family protein [Cryobacterium sp. SO2]|uniref:VOC family protein n=1 Tax=Cryobacterium sp. SO2 TaxID=1897060 RepID=UPI00223DCBB9|nr:VOC family protein [Cryobacterium sp. SO2]WEO76269.1 VOC family protein [Cryobacterium sp. SO2]
MPLMMFLNLPVTDLERSTAFYVGLGYTVNPQFTDESAACIVLEDGHLYLMLLSHDSYARFTSKPIVDSTTASEAIFSLSVDDRATVDRVAETALRSGGSFSADSHDLGFMYTRSFQDPDGHLWEITHLDLSAVPAHADESTVSGSR